MTSYRVDYATHADPNTPVVIFDLTRKQAMTKARKISADPKIGMAYAIANNGQHDTGQRVYAYGAYDHTDDVF